MHSTTNTPNVMPHSEASSPYFISEAPTLILDPEPTVLEPTIPPAPYAGGQPDALQTPKDLTANRSVADS